MLLPLFFPLGLPIRATNATQKVYDAVEALEENSKVLVSFEYGPSTKPEIHPMAIALLNQLFSKGIKVYIVSLWPEGVIMAKDALMEVANSGLFDIEDGIDYVMFDYKVGGPIVIKNIADDFRGIINRIIIKCLLKN